jgi:hypothetical protein
MCDFVGVCINRRRSFVQVAERNADYSRIASEMFGATRGPGLDVTSEYDVTVWCGDFNYRVNSNRRAADVLIENKMWEVMRANDQLNAERSKGRCFKVRVETGAILVF